MDVVESAELHSLNPNPVDVEETLDGQLLPCCKQTIDMHAAYNSMMVCSECKQIIKCFDDLKAFSNYQRFCASRHRRILATEHSDRYIVVFSSYDTYST